MNPATDWADQAACVGMDPAQFVPRGIHAHHDPSEAPAVCRACPVRVECEAFGIASGSLGWWGGRWLPWTGRGARAAS